MMQRKFILSRPQISKRKAMSFIAKTPGEQLFDIANVVIMAVLCLLTLYPFWYVIIMALNEGRDAATSPIWLLPRKFTLDNFTYVLQYKSLQRAYVVTILRCVAGAILSVSVNMLAAYALSKRFLPGRKAILYFFMMPMFIGGSIISYYVVLVTLGLRNNFLVYVLPGAFAFFTMVLMRTYMEGIPNEIEESAMLDGASYFSIFIRIILPLCKPVMAAFAFFAVVGGWLDLYTNLLFVTKRDLFTLQYILYMVIKSSEARNLVDTAMNSELIKRMINERMKAELPTPEVIKMAVMVVVTFPLLFIYPFFQKYFVHGMMVGAIKA